MSDTAATQKATEAPFTFFLGPFRFDSEIDIPELRGATGSGAMPVTLRTGGVPAGIPGALPFGAWCQVAPAQYLLNIPGTARFYASNGNAVRVEIEPGASLPDVSTYLLGSVFGALCHQNGMLPLHASAVEQGGRVTAFLGNSGAGKSTLAAFLHRRGYRIVSDDICLLEPGATGLEVVPVAGWLKLWRESFDQLGQAPEERNRIFSGDDKYRMYLGEHPDRRPLLRHLVFLQHAQAGDRQAPSLEPLPPSQALAGLMSMAYLAYIPELTGTQPELFRQCGQALSQAQAFRLVVPRGWEKFQAVLDLVEDKLLRGGE